MKNKLRKWLGIKDLEARIDAIAKHSKLTLKKQDGYVANAPKKPMGFTEGK